MKTCNTKIESRRRRKQPQPSAAAERPSAEALARAEEWLHEMREHGERRATNGEMSEAK